MPLLLGIAVGGCSGGPAPSLEPTPSVVPTRVPTAAASTPMPSLPPGVVAKIELGYRPSGIVAAGDYIWAEDHASTQAVYAIDPETAETVGTIQMARPCDFAEADGLLWVADLDASKLVAIDLETFEIADEVTGLAGPCGPSFAAGAIWLAVNQGFARLEPESGDVTVTELDQAAFPGAGTPLWVVQFGSSELGRVDVKTGELAVTIPHPGGQSEDSPIAAGFDSLWAGSGATERLYRLDPHMGAVRTETPIAVPSRLLVTEDSIWVTSYLRGTVQRVDPTTNEVMFHARLGGNPNGVTAGFGSVWVADTLGGFLYRIDPAATGTFE